MKNFADEEAYIDYCRHNYELSSRPSSIEKLNDDLTARETVLTFDRPCWAAVTLLTVMRMRCTQKNILTQTTAASSGWT